MTSKSWGHKDLPQHRILGRRESHQGDSGDCHPDRKVHICCMHPSGNTICTMRHSLHRNQKLLAFQRLGPTWNVPLMLPGLSFLSSQMHDSISWLSHRDMHCPSLHSPLKQEAILMYQKWQNQGKISNNQPLQTGCPIGLVRGRGTSEILPTGIESRAKSVLCGTEWWLKTHVNALNLMMEPCLTLISIMHKRITMKAQRKLPAQAEWAFYISTASDDGLMSPGLGYHF